MTVGRTESQIEAKGTDQVDQAARLRRIVDALPPEETVRGVPFPVATASVPRGAVSFRPTPARATIAPPRPAPTPAAPAMPRLARAIAITSGKGGVGKSNVSVNLAVALSLMGRKVCLLDADLGMANADVLCNVTPKRTLQHVVAGRCRLVEVAVIGPGGFRLIPGASGVAAMADLGRRQRAGVLEQLAAIERVADDIIIDCAAGISANVLAFAAAAHRTLVTTTPEPTALTDAYGMIKSLLRQAPASRIDLVVNMATGPEEGQGIHRRMNRVVGSFLHHEVGLAGVIPIDPSVGEAVRHRLPFTLFAPSGPATQAIHDLGRHLAGIETPDTRAARTGGFFSRLLAWMDR